MVPKAVPANPPGGVVSMPLRYKGEQAIVTISKGAPMVRACKICSLPKELAVQADSLLDEGTSLREISRILSLAGAEASFMSVTRHKKHYNPRISANRRLFLRELDQLESELQDLKTTFQRRVNQRWRKEPAMIARRSGDI